MTNRLEVYKCEICGNIVEVVHDGKGELVCCGQPNEALKENTVDVQESMPGNREDCQWIQRLRWVVSPHPMEEKHY
jgi:superoxide reductase